MEQYEGDVFILRVDHADSNQEPDDLVITMSSTFGIRGSFVSADDVLDAEDYSEECEFMERFVRYHKPLSKYRTHYN